MIIPTISQLISTIERDKKSLGLTLYEKAHQSEIDVFENTIGFKLPIDLKEFYSHCNGFESNKDLFRIIPLQEILDNRSGDGGRDFDIAEYMVYSDVWTIVLEEENLNNYSVRKFSSYKDFDVKFILTNSFAELLSKYIDGGVFEGLYKWEEEILDSQDPGLL